MDNDSCKISVLCAAYNHEDTVADALESFVRQKTDFAFEVLVNDDASADGTAAVIRSYAERYPEIIRPFYQPVNLYSLHRNVYEEFFIPNARGKYLAFCEGDDYWTDPDKLQLQADFLDSHPDYAACVHNTVRHFCQSSRPDEPFVPPAGDRDLSFADVVPGMGRAFHTSSLLARRDILARHPDFYHISFRYGVGDYPDALWLSLNGPIRFLERSMSVYRVCSNPGSWSANLDAQYNKFKAFVQGEIEMFTALRAHVSGEDLALVDRELLKRQYELLDLEGRCEEQLQPPYDQIYRSMPASYKCKHFLKRHFPGLHSLYRQKMGYGDW